MRILLRIRVLVALAVPIVAHADVAIAQTRPNIVLFIADDLGVGDIQPYGNAVVRTPNLQSLAQESLQFTRAFAASPTCSPSRSSLYTGLYPFRSGAFAGSVPHSARVRRGARRQAARRAA